MSRFEDGCSEQRSSAICIFVRDHPLLSVFVAAIFGSVVGNLMWLYI